MNNLDKINKLKAEQKAYIKKAQKIAMLPETKKVSTALSRAFKVVNYYLVIYKLGNQIMELMTQHAPNFEKSCIFHESGEEMITDKVGNKHFVEKPTI